MDLKKQTLLLFLFLLTGFFNKSLADTIPATLESTQTENNLFYDEIEKTSEDSMKLSIDGRKAFL